MLDKETVSAGLRYARSLQAVMRIVAIYSVDHAGASRPVQQSFDLLNSFLKRTGKLTLGFMGTRVRLNGTLTADIGLAHLEKEFLKRTIKSVSFEIGITMARYKQAIAILATPVETIERQGGLDSFLEHNRLESFRVSPLRLDDDSDSTRDDDKLRHSYVEAVALLMDSTGLETRPQLTGGGPSEIMRLIGPTVEAALVGDRGDPDKCSSALAHVLRAIPVDYATLGFPAVRQQELSALPPEELAGELIGDTTLRWATKHISATQEGTPNSEVAQDEVVRVVLRCMKATNVAQRLSNKLAQAVSDKLLPQSVYDRIQDETRWAALSAAQKQERLLKIARFNATEFRRLKDLIQELLTKERTDIATKLADRYFETLNLSKGDLSPEELSRASELIQLVAGKPSSFVKETSERLSGGLKRSDLSPFLHYQIAHCIATLGKTVALYEDYEAVRAIGSALNQCLVSDPSRHTECCGGALKNLMAPASVERIIELSLKQREDSAWLKTAAALLRWSGFSAVETVFHRLEQEQKGANRLVLVRLIGQTGAAALEVARKKLNDERWYVVRNACTVLGELKDPELLLCLRGPLCHSDHRVQQAALNVVTKTRLPGRAELLADSLTQFAPSLLDPVLDELLYLRDPSALGGLEDFLFGNADSKSRFGTKAVKVLAGIPGDHALELLAKILGEVSFGDATRKVALAGLQKKDSDTSQRLLSEFVRSSPDDPLAAQVKLAFRASK
jgi:hypothetical protein